MMTHQHAAARVLAAFHELQEALDAVEDARPPRDGCDRADWQDFVRETEGMKWTVKMLADLADSLRPVRRRAARRRGREVVSA